MIGKEQRHRLKPVATSEVIILRGRVTSFLYDDNNSNAKVKLSAQFVQRLRDRRRNLSGRVTFGHQADAGNIPVTPIMP